MNNSEIIQFLTSKTVNAGFIDKLKIRYRPIICPFIPLLEQAENKKSAFDIGCGSGQFSALLAKFTGVNKIKGIEISETLVRNAKQVNEEFSSAKNIQFSYFDGKEIPSDVSEYELVYMIDVFHHIPPAMQNSFMQQLYNKMSPGSTLVFKDINAGSPLVIFNKLHDLIFSKETGKEISFEAAEKLLKECGFTIKSKFKQTVAVYPHYFLIAEK